MATKRKTKQSWAEWKYFSGRLGGGNYYLKKEGFGISYNADPSPMVGLFAADGRGGETALCVNEKYYILNGDWRTDYEKLAQKGLKACMEFFRAHEADKSSWSN